MSHVWSSVDGGSWNQEDEVIGSCAQATALYILTASKKSCLVEMYIIISSHY